jgi:hypothetical protein
MLQQLADSYVLLSNEIKQEGAVLAEKRKELKKLDATLLVEMARQNVNEVQSDGVVLTRMSKLSTK